VLEAAGGAANTEAAAASVAARKKYLVFMAISGVELTSLIGRRILARVPSVKPAGYKQA
jgi:hypothetical protein